jgi:hypothetical protein
LRSIKILNQRELTARRGGRKGRHRWRQRLIRRSQRRRRSNRRRRMTTWGWSCNMDLKYLIRFKINRNTLSCAVLQIGR